MTRLNGFWQRLRNDRRGLFLLGAATLALMVVAYVVHLRPSEPVRLRACLNYGRNTPSPLARFLADEAAKHGLRLDFVAATGSEATLADLNAGKLDVAQIRSGVAREEPEIRQIAAGNCETVHVFGRGDVTAVTAEQLRDKRVAIGRPGSETRTLVEAILKFMGLEPGKDFVAVELQPEACSLLPPSELPDVVFDVSMLPSTRGEVLARECGYRLLDLPIGDALRLRDHAFEEVIVPACTYDVTPAVPEKPVRTVGCRVVLVARRDVSTAAIKRLLTIVFESDFARRAGMPAFDPNRVTESLDCPLHAGAIAYLDRNRPLIRAEMLESLQGIQGMLGTATCGVLLAWGWYRRMGAPGLDHYPQLLAELELEAVRLSTPHGLSDGESQRLRVQLLTIREEVLGHVAGRRLAADEKLSELLNRMTMVEDAIERLGRTRGTRTDIPAASRLAA